MRAAIAAQGVARWSNPLVVAILAAALAGLGNAVVAAINGSSQLSIEKAKNQREAQIEELKAESARIFEVIKAVDPDKAAENISFLLDAGLISNKERREALILYLKRRKGGEGIGGVAKPSIPEGSTVTTTTGPNIGDTKPSTETDKLIQYQTGWRGGGFSQESACAEGQAKLQTAHPGKKLTLVSSSETSKRDFLGRVEYNYFCQFKLSAK